MELSTVCIQGGRDCSMVSLPQKKYYRQRAHSNPIADHSFDYPISPGHFEWSKLYPDFCKPQSQEDIHDDDKDNESSVPDHADQLVEFADVGCGYGGLLGNMKVCLLTVTSTDASLVVHPGDIYFPVVSLSPMFPSTLMLGMEIRVKVSDYVMDRIAALRNKHPGEYGNVACVRTNAMKYLPNFFRKGQLSKMFFLFPDPHFKKTKHKWRIISPTLLAEYAYVLREGGLLYTITDVREVHDWMVQHISENTLFQRIPEDELQKDPVVEKLYHSTEEGQKVTRNKGDKFPAVFRRIPDPYSCDVNLPEKSSIS